MPRNDLNNSGIDRSDRQDKPVKQNDTARGPSAKDRHVSTWGKSSPDASAPQTDQAQLQDHLSKIGKKWVQERTNQAGDNLLREQRSRLDSIVPPPKAGDIHAFPYMGDVPADNLPSVPENLSHSSTIQKLADHPVAGKNIAENYRNHIMIHVLHSLAPEDKNIALDTAGKIIIIKNHLNHLMSDGESAAQNAYEAINTHLESIHEIARAPIPDELKGAINNFLRELRTQT